MANVKDRSLLHAKKKVQLARFELSEILPEVQCLTMDEEHQDLYLLQLNADLMQNLEKGDNLIIRGEPNDSAVICTESKTYELKEAETSNSLLLSSDLLGPEACGTEGGELKVTRRGVCGIFHNYFEVRELKPNFRKLKAVLEVNAYKGREYEDESAKNYRFEDLLDFIQASREELREALDNTLHTCIIDGYIRVLDFDYKFNVLSQIVEAVESKSLPFSKVPRDAIVESLEEAIPKEITERCFHWFAKDTDETDEHGHKLYAFDEDSVCRLYGEMLLRAAGKFHLNEFLESWQRSVPEGMTCSLTQLRGLALADLNYSPEVIFLFSCDDLPDNIAERFVKLFKVKEKWTYEEIVPYLQDRVSAGNDVKSLLIKYTRESTKDGIKLYSSKW